jgi:hypothetical protein
MKIAITEIKPDIERLLLSNRGVKYPTTGSIKENN